ncbi:MAG: UDP-galactopyranose mutase [Lachnospiraceae bacterium]
MEKKKYDYLLVGAGLFNAVVAHEMTKKGKTCLVLEKRNHIGGNCYTEACYGMPQDAALQDGMPQDAALQDAALQDAVPASGKSSEDIGSAQVSKPGLGGDATEPIQVHKYGAHIFHTSNLAVWAYVNQFAEFNNFINSPLARYKDELYNMPFNMNTFSKMWNIKTPREAQKIISEQIASLGITEPKNLEEQALSLVGKDVYEKLVKGYTEKQWGRDCKDLPAFIIKRLPLRFTYNNNYFNDRYQGIPEGGYTGMLENMFRGCDIMTGVDYLEDKEKYDAMADTVVYTGPIDRYFDYSLGVLEYRMVRFETEVLAIENYQGNAVVNYTEREVPYTRIIEHKHFAFVDPPFTVISREYPEEWKQGEEPYYPINDERNGLLYAKYAQLAKKEREEKNVVFGGRLGEYKYYDMDKVIEQAWKICETL